MALGLGITEIIQDPAPEPLGHFESGWINQKAQSQRVKSVCADIIREISMKTVAFFTSSVSQFGGHV